MTATLPRLKALRRSHCDTCGCARCKWIDAAIAGSDDQGYRADEGTWLVEGTLTIDEGGGLALQYEGNMIALEQALAGQLGHQVVVLVGKVKQHT